MSLRTKLADCSSTLRGWRYMIRRLASYQRRRLSPRRRFHQEAEFRRKFGFAPDYVNPRTFNEKLGWMRLNDHNPLYTQLADKIAVRDYVRERVGEEVLIPCYGVWDKPSEIPFDDLPNSFVLKCNHESGFVILCQDRAKLDRRFVRAQLATRLRMNYYYRNLEWHYRDIRPRILAEELLVHDQGGEPLDYKIYYFNGEPQYIYSLKDRHGRHPSCGFYSLDWKLLPCDYGEHTTTEVFPRPAQLERMFEIAAALSRGLYCCRIDLYEVRGKVYFGEITIIPGAGMIVFSPDSFDRYWGERLILPSAAELAGPPKT